MRGVKQLRLHERGMAVSFGRVIVQGKSGSGKYGSPVLILAAASLLHGIGKMAVSSRGQLACESGLGAQGMGS
jgi:hypothetical protein